MTPTLVFNPLSANFTKWSNTLKQFVGNLPTNCLSVFDHFVGLTLKGFNELLNNVNVIFQTKYVHLQTLHDMMIVFHLRSICLKWM